MGKQKGPLKLRGTIGDITWSKGKNGYTVKEKSEIPAELLAKGAQFHKLRAQQSEFGRAGKGVSVIRQAFDSFITVAKDFRMSQRMQKLMMQVVYSDSIHRIGERTVIDGDLSLLKKFEFNIDADWTRSIGVVFTPSIDRATGSASVSLPSYIPHRRITGPQGSTHFRIVCAATEIDFVNESFNTVSSESVLLPIDYAVQNPLTLTNALTPASQLPIIMVLGIQFSTVVNGFEDRDVSGRFNALTIVGIDQS